MPVCATVFACMMTASLHTPKPPKAYQRAMDCTPATCPRSHQFIKTPAVRRAVTNAFARSGISIPSWLFTNPSSKNILPIYRNGQKVIVLEVCRAYFCGSDSLIGEYNPANGSFQGVYTYNTVTVRLN